VKRATIRSAFILVSISFALSGCASLSKAWKGLLGHEDDPIAKVNTPRFSDQDTVKVSDNKQYRRMNRQRFEEEADVKADAGSLWVMEGQGAYLFSQNQMRMVGDLLNVKIDGAPRTQLQTKTKVISGLLARLESPQIRGPASQGAGPAPSAASATDPAAPAAADAAAKPGEAPKTDSSGFNVTSVPTRIIEQLKDGSYRVRGMQPFMIGKREYKVIVTGVVRPEDFDDAGIDAGKLLDPQFDIVSSRKGMM
jgi:flagellar L-ring protein precursor FlgH